MSRYTRGEKGEEIVSESFKGLQFPYYLINNLMLEDKKGFTHQIDHILICYKGIFVIETKNYYGVIDSNANDSIWIRTIGTKRDTFGNPMHQNQSHIRAIKDIIGTKFEYISLVVFVRNNAPYMPDDNVINFSDLLLFINEYPNNQTLDEESMAKINKILLLYESDASQKDHLSHIDSLKKKRVDNQNMIRHAIESRICPKCGKKLILAGNSLSCSNPKCKFNIKLWKKVPRHWRTFWFISCILREYLSHQGMSFWLLLHLFL